jgi:hypothetical protein
MTAQGAAFIVLGVLFTLLAVLAILRIGMTRLESYLGLGRDGLPLGTLAPAWELRDSTGEIHQAPSRENWQLLVFGDHSLKEFPAVVDGIRQLASLSGVEAILLSRANVRAVSEVARSFQLSVPIVSVDQRFYSKHNVRVMPFLIILDPDGRVRAEGLVNYEETVLKMWRRSQLSLAESRLSATREVAT